MVKKAFSLIDEALPECADSIESHPYLGGLFALATYQVDQQEIDREMRAVQQQENDDDDDKGAEASTSTSPPYTRRGMLRLYEAEQESSAVRTRVHDESHMAAILDTKWTLAQPSFASSSSRGILGVAEAKGHLTLHQLLGGQAQQQPWRLEQVADLELNANKALCLSLDWSDRIRHYPSTSAASASPRDKDASLVVSQSDGTLAWLPSIERAVTGNGEAAGPSRDSASADESDEDNDDDDDDDDDQTRCTPWPTQPPGLERWHAHDHEAWIAAFDTFSSGRTIWSGGDDLALKGWDVRAPLSRGGRRSPTFTNRKTFDGGVTTMQSHWSREGVWAVGSYDSRLRIFDARQPLRAVHDVELPGGIWRLKWHPNDPSLLLAGCMHGGFAVVKVHEDAREPEVVSTFEGHESLAYGCDWDRGGSDGKEEEGTMVYSCSFYDKKLCAWKS